MTTLREMCEEAAREVRSEEPPGDWAWSELEEQTRVNMITAIERVAEAFGREALRELEISYRYDVSTFTTKPTEYEIDAAIAAAKDSK